jgi:hypothetical protein
LVSFARPITASDSANCSSVIPFARAEAVWHAAQASSELKALEEELNGIIAWFVKGQASGTADSTAFSIAIAHAQHAIEKQREALRQGQTGSIPQQEP